MPTENPDIPGKSLNKINAVFHGNVRRAALSVYLRRAYTGNDDHCPDLVFKSRIDPGTPNQTRIGVNTVVNFLNDDLRFLSALIETAMILHNSTYLRDVDLEHVLDILNSLDLSADPTRTEFKKLVQKLVG